MVQSYFIGLRLHVSVTLRRISDHAVNIRDAAVENEQKESAVLCRQGKAGILLVFSNAIRGHYRQGGYLPLSTGDTGLAKEVEPLEQVCMIALEQRGRRAETY